MATEQGLFSRRWELSLLGMEQRRCSRVCVLGFVSVLCGAGCSLFIEPGGNDGGANGVDAASDADLGSCDANLLPNAGFERADVSPWSLREAEAELVPGAHSGLQALKICFAPTGEHDYFDLRQPSVALDAIPPDGTPYRLSIYVQGLADHSFMLRLGDDVGESRIDFFPSADFVRYDVVHEIAADQTALEVTLRSAGSPPSGTCVVVDDACLERQ